ncbi:FAD-dependent oxidoreductase [Dactylosporangium siamense]|uniref:FAD-binding monooxygenase n=1 Tax=Dactylosporangium siamense TaxID=685454 RepID=A0A919PSZ3_9ACTN|nr:squalene monooxygenase [Dactylosporangium siamense]GIG47873.1 FAD-binding monooxygenase [Dactylosporangium siamense]
MAGAGTAVVIGASMGGLLTVRVLSAHFAQVIVVDRDELPVTPTHRRCVPQGRQLHVLLSRGREALEELFPGLGAQLSDAGAPMVDLHGQVHWCNDGYPMRRAPSDLIAVGVSRPLLEHTVRERVAALPAVRMITGADVVSLLTGDGAVLGVRICPLGDLEQPYDITADLVVDAGGRASRSPRWLAQLGFPVPREDQVRVDVTYVTRVYQRDPSHLDGMLGALTNAVPGAPRAGIAAALEDDRVAVALSGMLGEQPPTDDAGMAAFADSLSAPHIATIVRAARPVSDAATMRFPASVRRRYERLRRFPSGYLVVADALCSFNPIYGQGMTVASLQALLLRRLLASRKGLRTGLARTFFRDAARIIDAPWSIAVGTDLRFREVPGRRTARVRVTNAFVHRLHAAATRDATLGAAFLRVVNLVRPPASLLTPGTLLRVLRGSLRRPRPAAAVPQSAA